MRQKRSWEITDEFREAAKPLIPPPERDSEKTYKRKPGGGRPPMDMRKALEGMFYVMRTGTQWKALPKEFGSSSSVHRYFRYWREKGFFQSLWVAGLERYDEIRGIQWDWLSADGCMTKAPLALQSVGNNPTDRGKKRKQAASSC